MASLHFIRLPWKTMTSIRRKCKKRIFSRLPWFLLFHLATWAWSWNFTSQLRKSSMSAVQVSLEVKRVYSLSHVRKLPTNIMKSWQKSGHFQNIEIIIIHRFSEAEHLAGESVSVNCTFVVISPSFRRASKLRIKVNSPLCYHNLLWRSPM